jgi:hypothetical protein
MLSTGGASCLAVLDLGDLFAYALAPAPPSPLPFKGDDFSHTKEGALILPSLADLGARPSLAGLWRS